MQPVAVEARFLHYVCLCPNFIELVDASTFGSKMPRAEWEFIGNIKIPVPPLPQQRAIADYLDRETARIDALIAAKERLLALLAEKRRALITRAVTRGLDPNAPMKDSGIPWLGEIPAHWTATRIKHVVTLRRSRVQSDEERKPYIGLEHVESWTGRLVSDLSSADEAAVSATRESDSLSSTFEPGDVLFGKLRPYLAKAWVAEFAGRCTTEALVMQPVAVEARFLRYVFLCPDFIDLVDASTFGSKMPRADWDFIGNIKIPLPPATEQRAIVEHITEETARLDALRAATERSIALLKERRAALISAAVTGQIDVPACAASTADREAVP
jgi:restriction endonuclease S subunit